MKPSPISPPEPPSVLAFGAHPDDIEFGCGGISARAAAEGMPVGLVVCSRGEAASHGSPASRVEEARQGAAILRAALEFVALDYAQPLFPNDPLVLPSLAALASSAWSF